MAFIIIWALFGVADKITKTSEKLGVFSRSQLDYEQKTNEGYWNLDNEHWNLDLSPIFYTHESQQVGSAVF